MTNMHTVQAWDIVRRLAQEIDTTKALGYCAQESLKLADDARALLAQVNTEAELRTMLEASEAARRELLEAAKAGLRAMTALGWEQGRHNDPSAGNLKAWEQATAAIAQAGAAPR